MYEDDFDLDGTPTRRRRNPTLRLAGGMVVFCIIGLAFVIVGRGFLPPPESQRPAAAAAMPRPAAAAPPAPGARAPLVRSIAYRADRQGHYFVDAYVNGAPVRFLVDTGATYLSLTPKDALAVGFGPGNVHYSMRFNTADGTTRAAPVQLRQVRLDQLELDDVSGVVMEQASQVSLLGMSFLSRLQGYSIRDGVLTLEW
jgi:aspartyl protease family protein